MSAKILMEILSKNLLICYGTFMFLRFQLMLIKDVTVMTNPLLPYKNRRDATINVVCKIIGMLVGVFLIFYALGIVVI